MKVETKLTVWTADCDGLVVAFRRQADAQAVAAAWNVDHAGPIGDPGAPDLPATVREMAGWDGDLELLWGALPPYREVWQGSHLYGTGGQLLRETPVRSRWRWAFETEHYTEEPAELVVAVVEGPEGSVEASAQVRGTDRRAVLRALRLQRDASRAATLRPNG